MNPIRLSILGTSFLSIILCCFCLNRDYLIMALLPITYTLLFALINKAYSYRNINLTVTVVGVLLWFRMVLIPLMGAIDSSYYSVINASNSSAVSSLYLCLYESIIVAVIVYLLSLKKSIYTDQPKVLYGNKHIYLLFILFAIIVFFTIGRSMHMFEFAIKAIGSGERAEEELDANSLLIRQIMGSGFLFLFLFLVDKFRYKYQLTHNNKYITCALICAMLMICIITGERRTSQIYTAFCTCWLLITVFPKSKDKIIKSIIVTAGFVLIMMSIYKHFNAFLYDSYTEALSQGDFDEGFSAGMFDAYFYGISTISKNIEFGEVALLSPFNFLYDIARCTFGLNFFVPRGINLTSEAYNLYMYGGLQTHGYLLSSVGYGYIYFGPVLAPIASFINVILLSFFERKLRNANSIEMTYIWAYLFMRFGFGFLGSLPPLISLASRYIFFNGSLFFFAKIFNRR